MFYDYFTNNFVRLQLTSQERRKKTSSSAVGKFQFLPLSLSRSRMCSYTHHLLDFLLCSMPFLASSSTRIIIFVSISSRLAALK